MPQKNIALFLVTALFLSACSYAAPAATTTTTPEQNTAPTVTPAPSYVYGTSTTEMSTELESTVDDGGQSDVKQLEKESSGL